MAEERLQRRAHREYAVLFTSIMVASLSIYLGPAALIVLPLSFIGIALFFLRLKRRSAMAIMASRRRRFSKELGRDVQIGSMGGGFLADPVYMKPEIPDSAFKESPEPDPETLDVKELLKWMGAQLDG